MTSIAITKNRKSIVLAFFIMLLCSGLVNVPAARAASEPEAEAAVTNFLAAVKEVNAEKMATFCTESTVDKLKIKSASVENMVKMLYQTFKYQILFSDSEGDIASIKLRITNADTKLILGNVDYLVEDAETQSIVNGKRLSDDEKAQLRDKYFQEAISKEDAPTSTSDVYITLHKNSADGTWQIDMTNDFKNAILGQGWSLSVAKAVDFLEALKRADSEKIAASFSGLPLVELKFSSPEYEKVTKMFLKKLQYEIVSSKINGDSTTVTIKVNYVDTIKLLEGVQKEVFPKLLDAVANGEEVTDEMIEKLTMEFYENSLTDGTLATENSNIDFEMVTDSNGEWLIKDLDQFVIRSIIGYLD